MTTIDVPTLLVWGRHDPVFERSLADRSLARCTAGELVVVETGHAPHRESTADLAERIDAFLRR